MKNNLFYLLREYCLSHENCTTCKIEHDDEGYCRMEDIDDWSNKEIKKYTKLLIDWGNKNYT